MRVRCPKCSSVNVYPDEKGWGRTECPICSHSFVATKLLAVADKGDGDGPPASDEGDTAFPKHVVASGGGDLSRKIPMAVAAVALLGAGLLARAWLVARLELRKLESELSELAKPSCPGSDVEPSDGAPASGSHETGSVVSVKKKLKADRVLATLQEAVIEKMRTEAEELGARIRILESKVERGENALAKEKNAHGDTKRKLATLRKENASLRRELEACIRQIRNLEMRLERGR